jgi:hypothetical protein
MGGGNVGDARYEYVTYIDEAGDPGLKRVKPNHVNGSSEWLIVSGVVVSREHEAHVVPWIREIVVREERLSGGLRRSRADWSGGE